MELTVGHDVGRGFVVDEVDDELLTCVDLRLDADDVARVERWSDLRQPDEPSSEDAWFRGRRVLFWKAKLQVGSQVLRLGADGEWVECKISKVVAAHTHATATYTLPAGRVVCKDTTFLNKRAITRARQHARLWGAGMAAPPQPQKVERHVVRPETATHLLGWVFRTEFVEVLH